MALDMSDQEFPIALLQLQRVADRATQVGAFRAAADIRQALRTLDRLLSRYNRLKLLLHAISPPTDAEPKPATALTPLPPFDPLKTKSL